MGAIALSSALPQGAAALGPAPARPNFIFVTTDGHRPDALSLNGNRILQTPNIDRIGREGMQFQNSFVVNALCLPSRATALTGLYSHRTGCVDNKDDRAIPLEVPHSYWNMTGESSGAALAVFLQLNEKLWHN
jgi:hypothetical protein